MYQESVYIYVYITIFNVRFTLKYTILLHLVFALLVHSLERLSSVRQRMWCSSCDDMFREHGPRPRSIIIVRVRLHMVIDNSEGKL